MEKNIFGSEPQTIHDLDTLHMMPFPDSSIYLQFPKAGKMKPKSAKENKKSRAKRTMQKKSRKANR